MNFYKLDLYTYKVTAVKGTAGCHRMALLLVRTVGIAQIINFNFGIAVAVQGQSCSYPAFIVKQG